MVPYHSYVVVVFFVCSSAAVQADLLKEAPMDMVVANSVYVLGSSSVTVLDRNITLRIEASLEFLQNTIPSGALRMTIKADETEMLVCFVYGKCFLFNTMDYLADDNLFSASFESSSNIVLTSIQLNSFYIAHLAYDKVSPARYIQLNHYSIEDPKVQYEEYNDYAPSLVRRIRFVRLAIRNSSFLHRKFSGTFSHNSYMYFVGIDEFANLNTRMFLMRVCDKENGSSSDGYGVYEIPLSCGPLSQETDIIIGIVIFHSFLFLDVSKENYMKQCVFNITEIDIMMDNAYDSCWIGKYLNPLPWASYNMHNCGTFSQVSLISHKISCYRYFPSILI